MEISQYEQNEIVILVVSGSLVQDSVSSVFAEKIRQVVAEGKRKVVVDMAEVNWMDSAGIGILLGGFITLHNHSGDLRLARPKKKIRNLLEITNLCSVVRVFKTLEEAIKSYV